MIRAAGGVVAADGTASASRSPRPPAALRRLDVPEGQAEGGETDEDCALREVEEETGLRCALGARAPLDGVRRRAGTGRRSSAGGRCDRSPASESDEDEVDDTLGARPTRRRSSHVRARPGLLDAFAVCSRGGFVEQGEHGTLAQAAARDDKRRPEQRLDLGEQHRPGGNGRAVRGRCRGAWRSRPRRGLAQASARGPPARARPGLPIARALPPVASAVSGSGGMTGRARSTSRAASSCGPSTGSAG